ncbi:proton myo-inositol cotransporter-like isoform X2 [Stegostoma tigrinum]|uniref:proton myo-inositol cotransporter-like isoform X2 n=1 Tax=Stegostoma tigrinum TaxID=3053191 RepID=UPI00202B9830|nr:proton myo-inositol cotransporter-like isoform X2 [Stegostoma tigrinum]
MSRKDSDAEYSLRDLSGKRWIRPDGRRETLGERTLIKPVGSGNNNNNNHRRQLSRLTGMATGAEGNLIAHRHFQGGGGGGGGGSSRNNNPRFVYVLATFAALGGFLFGYDTGVVSGALLLLKKEFALNELWQELVVSATVGAAAISALAGGLLNGYWGRKPCILLASLLFTLGAVVMTAGSDRNALLAGRVVVGLGIGLASMTVTVYIAEAAPSHLRGRLVTVNTLFITGGQFFASVIDGAFSYLETNGWRYMLGLSAVPAVVQFVGFLFLPESPRWLVQKGKTQKARRVLSQIRGTQNIDEEYECIKSSIEEEERETVGGGTVFWKMITYPPTRRALIVGCGLQLIQQLSGINTVMYYSATILQMSGVQDDTLAIWLAAVTAFTNFIFTLIGVWLVEKVGRRKLTLGSLTGTALSLMILAIGFLLSAQASPSITLYPRDPSGRNGSCAQYKSCNNCMLDPTCGFCFKMESPNVTESSCVPVSNRSEGMAAWGRCSNASEFKKEGLSWAYNFCPTVYSWTALLGLILYLVFFAPGMGSMPWTVNSEIYPMWARSTGNACSSGVNWIFNVLVSVSFLHLAEHLTYYGAFFLYSGLTTLGLFFVYGCLPETKGLKLEEIESLFENRLCTCGLLDSDEGRHIEYIRVKGSNYHLSDNDASDIE